MIAKTGRKRLLIITLVLAFGLVFLAISLAHGQGPPDDPTPMPQPTFAPGDVFAAVESNVKWYHPDGTFVMTLTTGQPDHNTGMAFDAAGNLYVTNWAYTVTKFNTSGTLLGTFGSGYSSRPEGIVLDCAGNVYVGTVYGRDNDIRKFDAEGNPLAQFDVETERQGSDWIDLAADQCTMRYTSEGKRIMQYDVCTDTQLEDFRSGLPGAAAFALRILPDGGVLVADSSAIHRLDSTGTTISTYTYTCTTYWRNLGLAPDGTSFWGGCTDRYFVEFDITTGGVLNVPIDPGPGRFRGLTVFGEPTAASCADLAVTKADSPDPVTVGNNLIYTVIVTNNGPWEATGVMLTDTLPASVTFVSAPDCTEAGGTVTCNLGTLASGASATVTIVVNPTKEGMITNTVSVTGDETDLNTANNTATENTTVTAPSEPTPAAVPEASTLFLLGSGLASLAGYAGLRLRARRRDRR